MTGDGWGDEGGGFARRSFLHGAGVVGLLALVPFARWDAVRDAPNVGGGRRLHFLDAHEFDILRAVTARFLPGPPEDRDPGAIEGRCAEAIDALLGAFSFDPPLIHAGGPFSGRAGGHRDDLARFVPMDRATELGWRIRLEGTRGLPERAFAGEVRGWQQEYRDGLALLDARTPPPAANFATAPATVQDAVLRDDAVGDFATMALGDTLTAMLGPPEYGGNRKLVGWRFTHWPGDVQPRGYTDRQVSRVDRGSTRHLDAKRAKEALGRLIPGLEDLT